MPTRDIVITKNADGLTIILPAPGLRGSKPEFKFALAFTGVMCFITAVFVMLLSGGQAPLVIRVLAIGLLGLFWCGAAALLVNAWRRANRRAIIDVIGETLLISTGMPFSKGSIQTERTNIKALGVGPSGVVVDNVAVLALRLDLRRPVLVGKKNKRVIRLFRERSEDELERIAGAVRDALGIKTDSDPAWAKDAASSSHGSYHHLY